ncbi:C40 family peptidase [Anaeromicropila herbilytica]|uniref:Uncharacterized protein n=1 Tax=Anaeromicropila herbilytica TaxID=2785025 RepID=A0A7R7EIY8_9FIRM|nr:C40 family peptidase [Anaeromicropila herbilytica]BCN29652.1 hypothetical protein bsdtb5_09470 [Anaeromicropila herbilytica]
MQKVKIVKASMCLTAAALITLNTQYSKAATTTDTALAGITISLDRYYDATVEESLQQLESENSESAKALRSALNESTSDSQVLTSTNESAEASTSEATNTTTQVSPYENVGISIASDYVNIRNKPSESAEVLGKLYEGSSAKILDVEGAWVKVKSGSVEGYIMASYLAIGSEAEKVADKYGTKLATVTTTTLKVREKMSQDATVLTLIPEGETYEVLNKSDKEKEASDEANWVKIQIDSDLVGFVSKDYVDITVKFKKAISIKEELEQKEKEEAQKREEAEKAAEKVREAEQSSNSSNSSSSSSSSSSRSSSSSSSNSNNNSSSDNNNNNSSSSNSSSSNIASGTASDIIAYAKRFLGNRYVYGGTSLTNGTDCSGFTMSIFAHFGYSIPRTSGSQSGAGTAVSLSNVQPGDLVFYGVNGRINHVTIYIGGGQVIHASNPTNGILISNWKYRNPICARRIIH